MAELVGAAKGFKSMADIKHVVDRIKHAKVVMLGEASHGTQEYYFWRRLISQELIRNHGFSFIGVEGDWPPTQQINYYIGAEAEAGKCRALKTLEFHDCYHDRCNLPDQVIVM